MRRGITNFLNLVFILSIISFGIARATVTWDNGDTISSSVFNEDINMNGDLVISGDIVVCNNHGGGASIDITVTADTYILPDSSSRGHLIFYAAADSLINVNVNYDLFFTGSNDSSTHEALIITFSGPGQTKFNITNGKEVGFEGFWETYSDDYTETCSGTHVYITMDQSYAEAISNGVNKVVFARESYSAETNDTTKVTVGRNSFITFLSDNEEGNLENLSTDLDFGSVAFDVSNSGYGRMLLHLKGSYTVDSDGGITGITDGYNDGSFVIAGHYVSDLSSASEIRSNVIFKKRAGVDAIFRIIDEKAYADSTYRAELGNDEAKISSVPTRRGLLVVNENKSIARFAADPYLDNDWYDYTMYEAGKGSYKIQPGFVLGLNGSMEIFHNTFLDYIAASTMRYAPEDSANVSIIKKHNPSAFVVDGFSDVDKDGGTLSGLEFEAHASALGGRHAYVTLRGDARMYLRSGVAANGYVDWNKYLVSGDYLYSFTIGSKTYDGNNLDLGVSTIEEGNHVFDIEGRLTIRSTEDNNSSNDSGFVYITTYAEPTPSGTFARHAVVSNAQKLGMINLPPVKIDQMGREIINDSGTLVTHPLTKTTVSYPCYNSSSIFTNANLALDGIRFEHDQLYYGPTFVGGEKRVFNSSTSASLPLVYLYTTTIFCHEGLSLTGVRLVVTDKREYDLVETQTITIDNLSSIKCYNHGDILDTLLRGYGRVFEFGSSRSLLADGSSNSSLINSGYCNIYRTWGDATVDWTSGVADVKLVLQTGLQPTYVNPYTENISGVTDDNKAKAMQFFYLYNDSNMSVGWTTTVGDQPENPEVSDFVGCNEASRPTPWTGILDNEDFYCDLSDTKSARAELYINGDYYCFFGANNRPVTSMSYSDREDGIIYVDHGGKITIADDKDCYVDSIIAVKAWPQVFINSSWEQAYAGKVDIPHDQGKFNESIQPYALNFERMFESDSQTKDSNLRVSSYYYGTTNQAVQRKKSAGEIVTIGWKYRADHTTTPSFYPARTRNFDPFKTVRSTQLPTARTMTSNLITVSSGDYITQMRVAGATQADPFHLYITGDPDCYGYVRELTSFESSSAVPGEGCNAVIFLDNSGHVGLGSRGVNEGEYARSAWNILGQDYVTLCPNGNGVVVVNSDLILADRWAIVPTENFGHNLGSNTSEHRLTFFSDEPREIRIPMGSELDLSAFNGGSAFALQQIEFSGKIRLILESGASIRFPSNPTYQPIMYFNDESELIFEEHNHRDEGTWTSYAGSESIRSKILGQGQIWMNKFAKLKINGYSFVGVQSDDETPTTNITISLDRESQMIIGNENISGGTFQVGNPVAISGGQVDFSFATRDRQSVLSINRDGFFGLGAGLRNKYDEPNDHWNAHALFDVNDVSIAIKKGIIDHGQIFDGDSSNASIFAIGPVDGTYEFKVGPVGEAYVRGGGNLVYITNSSTSSSPHTLSIDSTAESLVGVESSDTGKYSILASYPIFRQVLSVGGSETISSSSSYPVIFTSTVQADLFNFLRYHSYPTITPAKYVCLGTTRSKEYVGYVVGTSISRETDVSATDLQGNPRDPAESLFRGVLGSKGAAIPLSYVVLR
jgi:hypothetical protein